MMSNSEWQRTQLFFSGDEYFRSVLTDIGRAERSILIESYIFDYDTIGSQFIDALNQARERGVNVKILVDGVGSFNWLGPLADSCQKYGIALRVYHPLPLSLKSLRRISWRNLRRLLLFFRKANKRNHRKVIVIDHRISYLGSLNISQVHSERFSGSRAWRDTGVRLVGGEVERLVQSFRHVWHRSRFPTGSNLKSYLKIKNWRKEIPFLRKTVLRMNSTATWRFFLFRDLKRRIKAAQRRILVTNAYFLPRRSFLRHLRKAALRGVYVGVCIPGKLDYTPVHWGTKHLYRQLLKDGVHIFEYQKSLMHAKTLVIDDWATVGSQNLNHRSLIHDLEVEAVLTAPASLQQLTQQWDLDIGQSKKVTFQDLGQTNFFDKLVARFVYWWRYWL